MFIELIDALRCPDAHAESWLVLATTRMEQRHVVNGTLGCPVCLAEYAIREGVTDFRRNGAGARSSPLPSDADAAMRMAALLNLSESHGFAVLLGDWAAHGEALKPLVEVPLILVDPPAGIEGSTGASVILTDGGAIPIAASAARGTAIDGGSAARVNSAVTLTKATGRIVAPSTLLVMPGVKELARDESMWVGERESAVSGLVTLHVRRAE